jgi:hypothetical protein
VPVLEALAQEPVAGRVPHQALHPVAVLVVEAEEMPGLRVLLDYAEHEAR